MTDISAIQTSTLASIESAFLPDKLTVRKPTQSHKRKSVTTHRLLTSDDIISEKKATMAAKEKREEEKDKMNLKKRQKESK